MESERRSGFALERRRSVLFWGSHCLAAAAGHQENDRARVPPSSQQHTHAHPPGRQRAAACSTAACCVSQPRMLALSRRSACTQHSQQRALGVLQVGHQWADAAHNDSIGGAAKGCRGASREGQLLSFCWCFGPASCWGRGWGWGVLDRAVWAAGLAQAQARWRLNPPGTPTGHPNPPGISTHRA